MKAVLTDLIKKGMFKIINKLSRKTINGIFPLLLSDANNHQLSNRQASSDISKRISLEDSTKIFGKLLQFQQKFLDVKSKFNRLYSTYQNAQSKISSFYNQYRKFKELALKESNEILEPEPRISGADLTLGAAKAASLCIIGKGMQTASIYLVNKWFNSFSKPISGVISGDIAVK